MEVALKLLEKMRECSLLPKVVTYTALIDRLCKRDECLLYKMLGVGVHPNYIDGSRRWLLFKKGSVDNAVKYIGKMCDQGFRFVKQHTGW